MLILDNELQEKIDSLESFEIGDRAASITASIIASDIYCETKKMADLKQVDVILNQSKLKGVKERHMSVVIQDKTLSNEAARNAACYAALSNDPYYDRLQDEVATMEKDIIELRALAAHHKNIYVAVLVFLGFADGSFIL